MKLNWTKEQETIFGYFGKCNHTDSPNMVVSALAGTGKTSTSKEGFNHAPESSILYAVFNKKNQVEAAEKITNQKVTALTLHALGYRLIKNAWGKIKADYFVEQDRVRAIQPDIPEDAIFPTTKLISYLKNLYVSVPTAGEALDTAESRDIFCTKSLQDKGYTVEKIADIARKAMELARTKDKLNRISFDDMVWLPGELGFIKPQFDLVCIDECQDMNLPQLHLAMDSCRKDGRICLVGDERQAIYGFRGAFSNSISYFKRQLKANELGLTTTYRCPRKVVELAQSVVPEYKAFDSAPDGTVDDLPMNRLEDKVNIGDVILSRKNAPLMPICLSLIRGKTPARIEGKDVAKTLINIVKQLNAFSITELISKLEKWGNDRIKDVSPDSKYGQQKISLTNDYVDTLKFLAESSDSPTKIIWKINEIFGLNDRIVKPVVLLSTVHKAKGLEWPRVFMLSDTFNRNSPDPEETNIWYVAVTRAMKHLTIVK